MEGWWKIKVNLLYLFNFVNNRLIVVGTLGRACHGIDVQFLVDTQSWHNPPDCTGFLWTVHHCLRAYLQALNSSTSFAYWTLWRELPLHALLQGSVLVHYICSDESTSKLMQIGISIHLSHGLWNPEIECWLHKSSLIINTFKYHVFAPMGRF